MEGEFAVTALATEVFLGDPIHRGIRAKATLHRTFPRRIHHKDTDSQHEGQEKPETEKRRAS
jgi:hypothetical protein